MKKSILIIIILFKYCNIYGQDIENMGDFYKTLTRQYKKHEEFYKKDIYGTSFSKKDWNSTITTLVNVEYDSLPIFEKPSIRDGELSILKFAKKGELFEFESSFYNSKYHWTLNYMSFQDIGTWYRIRFRHGTLGWIFADVKNCDGNIYCKPVSLINIPQKIPEKETTSENRETDEVSIIDNHYFALIKPYLLWIVLAIFITIYFLFIKPKPKSSISSLDMKAEKIDKSIPERTIEKEVYATENKNTSQYSRHTSNSDNKIESHKKESSYKIAEESKFNTGFLFYYNEINTLMETSERDFRYDVCFSFANEDRKYVEEVANQLKVSNISVFYDGYEQVKLWGKDLYTHLDSVYRTHARYCVMFISAHYAKKLWTNHERKSAQARAFTENSEYILPARFDDTEIPGILPTTGYISLSNLSPSQFASLIKIKILGEKEKTIPKQQNDNNFRRIFYESFDSDHLTQKQKEEQFGKLWLIGASGHWIGNIQNSVFTLKNVSGSKAVLTNRIRYFEPGDEPVDLGNSKASVRVKVGSPTDSFSSGGLLFRSNEEKDAYFAYFLQAGNTISIAKVQSGKLTFLWSQDINEVLENKSTLLKIIGENTKIYFYLDNNLVHSINDTEILTGNTGIIALSLGTFTFDEFTIHIRK